MWRPQTLNNLRRLGQSLAVREVRKSQGCLAIPVRQYWNKDWAADAKRPETKAEIEAAAKKYGLLPEDYQPYPDEGMAMGDYPQLPDKGVDSRDPWEDYDMPSLRRNFGDPVHLHADIYGEDRYQPDNKYFTSIPKQYLFTAVLIVVYAGLAIFLEDYKTTTLILEKQLPYQYKYTGGEKPTHYTFKDISKLD